MEAAGELNKMRIRAEGTGEIRLGNILAMMLSHGCDKVQLKPGSQEEHCVHVSHKQPGGKATSESSCCSPEVERVFSLHWERWGRGRGFMRRFLL